MRYSSIAAELEHLASQPDLDSCPECGSPLVEKDGEKVCHTCGTRQPIITQELAPGIRQEVMSSERSAFLPLLLEGIGAMGAEGAAAEGAGAAAGMGAEGGGANLGLGQVGTLMNNAMQGNQQQENSPAVQPGAAGALGNPGQSMSIAPPGVVGRVAAGMFGDPEVGTATKNRGENSQPGAASETGLAGSKEIGDSPEQFKDIGEGGRASGDPFASDKDRDADGSLGDVATKAFHQNLPLVVEFAFSDQSGADHPILKALDEMLEQAYPGYKDGETFNETDTGESPTEKMEEVIGQDLDDDEKHDHDSTAGSGAAAEVKPKMAPVSKRAGHDFEDHYSPAGDLSEGDICPNCQKGRLHEVMGRGGVNDYLECPECDRAFLGDDDYAERESESYDPVHTFQPDPDHPKPATPGLPPSYYEDVCKICGQSKSSGNHGQYSHKTASDEWESLVAMVEELAQKDAKAGSEMMPMNMAPQSGGPGHMVELPLDEVIQHLQSWPGLMGGVFHREFEALGSEDWEQLADYYREAFDLVANPDYGTGGGTFPDDWTKDASQREAIPATSVGMGYQTPGAAQVAPQQTTMMPGTGVPGAHGVEQCAVCGQAHMPGMCPLADNAGGPAGMDTGQAVTPPPPMPVITHQAAGEGIPTAGATPGWDGADRREGVEPQPEQQSCPFCQMELRDGACPRCGRTSEDLLWTKLEPPGSRMAAPHDEDLERFAEDDAKDEHHDNRYEDSPEETGWYEDWKGPQEDDEDNPWKADNGEPLEPGQDYEMHSSQYAIPDKITIEHVTPDKMTFLIHSGDVDYRDEVDKEDVANYGYTFKRPKSDELDSESGFEEADAALPGGPPPSQSHNLKSLNLTDPRPHEGSKTADLRDPGDVGDRVELIHTSDPYSDLQPGATGVIRHIDAIGTVHVQWDNGSTLGLVPQEDSWRVIGSDSRMGSRTAEMEEGEGQFFCPICGIKDSEEMGKPCIHCQRNEDMEAAGAGMFDEQAAIPPAAFDPLPQQDDLSAPPTKQGHNVYTDPFGNEMEYTGSFRGDPVDSRDWLMADSSPVDVDPALMAKLAGKDFSPQEQRSFIDEEGKGGPARNLHKLDLSGTHYESEGDFGDSFF